MVPARWPTTRLMPKYFLHTETELAQMVLSERSTSLVPLFLPLVIQRLVMKVK